MRARRAGETTTPRRAARTSSRRATRHTGPPTYRGRAGSDQAAAPRRRRGHPARSAANPSRSRNRATPQQPLSRNLRATVGTRPPLRRPEIQLLVPPSCRPLESLASRTHLTRKEPAHDPIVRRALDEAAVTGEQFDELMAEVQRF